MHTELRRGQTVGSDAVFCLLISCSERKHLVDRPISALELYDGSYYRIIKKLMREGRFPPDIDIVIISARYGLLRQSDLILPYDQKMTARRAVEMRDKLLAQLASALKAKQYRGIFVNLGRHYLNAIVGFESLLPDTTIVMYAKGGIGQRGSQMKKWILSKKWESKSAHEGAT